MRALCSLLLPGLLCAQTLDVKTHTLSNGLKIIIHEDHDIPNATMYLFYRVGSRNEGPGTTGISHFFEHMMFNGAQKYGPHQFDIEMEKNGGRTTPTPRATSPSTPTGSPPPFLPTMMDMEADRMKSLAFDPKMIESERGVVYSEREQSVDNSNFGLLYEQLNAAAFVAHPYGWPVVGWASDIKAWTMDDLKRHFRMGYAPNNCVMVVAGDVSAANVIALAKKEFESIPRQEPPPAVRTVEPRQQGERRVSVVKAAQLPMQMYSYHIPNAAHGDAQVLQVLGSVLSQGQSSRLYRRLVDGEQLALSQSFFIDPTLDPGQLIFTLQPRDGVDPAIAEKSPGRTGADPQGRDSTGGTAESQESDFDQPLPRHENDLRQSQSAGNL
jgi:Predicted Zn-dependent peptidases